MDPEKKGYEGLKCLLCWYWFSKMYLFKQHSRKYHSALGEFIDIPAIPTQVQKYYNIQDEVLFALLHCCNDVYILMRIYETESHATMRIANKDDIAEANKKQKRGTKDELPIKIVYDVYPKPNEAGSLSFNVLSRIKRDNNWNVSANTTEADHSKQAVVPKPYYQSFKFSNHPGPQRKREHVENNLDFTSNPFVNLLEYVVDNL
ncbi:uncharacterized protein LOC128730803 [Anopheles nili]|uniref:uncharacterized protein LOC128730803 n=1 Tax=Anopheles nili TaxID=185578 RepID=UPI00237BF490|nr:uncharacterized protein LOC128730803 [Anopheles nili]